MAVVRGKLEFHNVVGIRTRCTYGDWKESVMILRAFLVENDIFITGPIILYWENVDKETKMADVNILLPTYQKLELENNDKLFYQEKFIIPDGIKIRHSDITDEIEATEMYLGIMAEKAKLTLKKPFYYIYLPVFQEYVIDIYAPIEGELL